MIAIYLSYIAESIGVVGSGLQLRHTLFAKKVKGLSGWSWALNLSGNIAWVSYGFTKEILPLLLANLILALFSLAILARIFLSAERRLVMFGMSILVGLTLTGMFIYFEEYSGWIAATFNLIASLPQTVRATTARSMKGVSLHSHLVWVVAEIMTFIYAVLLSAWPLVAGSIRGILTNSYIAIQTKRKT